MPEKIYKSALEQAEQDYKEDKIDEKQLDVVEKDEETRNKLKELGYTDDEIGALSGDDFELAQKFFKRFDKKETEEETKEEDK